MCVCTFELRASNDSTDVIIIVEEVLLTHTTHFDLSVLFWILVNFYAVIEYFTANNYDSTIMGRSATAIVRNHSDRLFVIGITTTVVRIKAQLQLLQSGGFSLACLLLVTNKFNTDFEKMMSYYTPDYYYYSPHSYSQIWLKVIENLELLVIAIKYVVRLKGWYHCGFGY